MRHRLTQRGFAVALGLALSVAVTPGGSAAAAGSGITDVAANNARGSSTVAAPQTLLISAPAAGRYVLVVSRAKVGTVDAINGDFGSFALTLDEAGAR